MTMLRPVLALALLGLVSGGQAVPLSPRGQPVQDATYRFLYALRKAGLTATATRADGTPWVPDTTMDLSHSMGFILKMHRTAFGLTQDSLSKLTHRTVSASSISRMERGLQGSTVAQQDSLVLALLRVIRVRIHPLAMDSFNLIVLRNISRP